MAILLNAWQRHNPRRKFSFLATDYSQRVLKQAEEGRYSQLEVQRGLPATMMVRFFRNETNSEASESHSPTWVVSDDLKKNISFKQQNLLEDFGNIGPFDLVLCRNVLIYQNVENKRKIIAEIARRIAPDGYLIMGAAESLMGLSEDFDLMQLEKAVVYKKKSTPKT
jgi:chemotaxis protein methyltransferase CheR